MAQFSLYYQTQLETKVSLLPEHIDGNIDDHIMDSLRAKIDGKTIENGIVIRIIRLIDYDYGIIGGANFMATTVYNVKYECLLCSPVKDLEIICSVHKIVKGFLICRNGPVVIAINISDIDTHTFNITGDKIKHISTNHIITHSDFLKVSVTSVANNPGDVNIVAMCKLLNIANKNEIKKFHEEEALIKNISEKDAEDFF